MSYISSNQNARSPLWKLSDQAKAANKQFSLVQPSHHLPQRFSPTKSGVSQSKIQNSSKERLKWPKQERSREKSPSYQRLSVENSVSLQEHKQQKSQIIQQRKPSNKQQKICLNCRESRFSLFSDHSKHIIPQEVRQFVRQHQANRKIILGIKQEFKQFQVSILQAVNHQRAMVIEFMAKIQQICNKNIKSQETFACQKAQKKLVNEEQKQIISRVQIFQTLLNSAEQGEKKFWSQKARKDPEQETKFQQLSQLQNSSASKKDEGASTQLRLQEEIKQSNQQFQENGSSKKSRVHLLKCNQIVQTINILNEINASPISKLKNGLNSCKSTQRLFMEESKQKTLVSIKSNDKLIDYKTNEALLKIEQKGKTKGSFKLEKFYNAIQKLKQEVNQIKIGTQIKIFNNQKP